MKTMTTIMTLLGFLVLALASPGALLGSSARNVDDMPWPVVPMRFKGTLGGYDVQFNGSIQEVYAQMNALHPEFNPNAPLAGNDNSTAGNADLQTRAKLDGRSKMQPPLCCPIAGQSWSGTDTDPILGGITYLQQLDGGNAQCGVDARSCVRISCSYKSAIYLCNDNDFGITPACPYMASYAQDLVNDCSVSQGGGYYLVCGQEFDTDYYNIIVRWDPTNGC